MATLIRMNRKQSQKNPHEYDAKENEIQLDDQSENKMARRTSSYPVINSFGMVDSQAHQHHRVERTIQRVRLDGMEAYSMSTTTAGKLFWCLLIIISLIVMIVQLSRVGYEYWSSPLVTTFSIQPMAEITFPQIYICPTNNINKTYLEQNPSVAEEVLNLKKYFLKGSLNLNSEGNENLELFNEKSKVCQQRNSSSRLESSILNSSQLYQRHMAAGLDPNQFFTSCRFHTYYSENIPCLSIVRSLLDNDYGKCFLVSLADKKQKLKGKGLLLQLNLSHNLFPEDICLMPDSTGIRLFVSKSLTLSDKDYIFVRPGTYNNLDLTAQYLEFQDVRHGPSPQPCINDKEIQLKFINGNYSQVACQLDCELDILNTTCNCIPLTDPYFLLAQILNNTKFCTKEQKQNCINPKVYQSPSAMKQIDTCKSKCFQSCTYWRFPIVSSAHQLNPHKYSNDTNINDRIYLHISFANMEIEYFVQNPLKTIDEMISNIGGVVNLWLGASMITLLQIPVALAILVSWALYGNVKKTRGNSVDFVPRKSFLGNLFASKELQ